MSVFIKSSFIVWFTYMLYFGLIATIIDTNLKSSNYHFRILVIKTNVSISFRIYNTLHSTISPYSFQFLPNHLNIDYITDLKDYTEKQRKQWLIFLEFS